MAPARWVCCPGRRRKEDPLLEPPAPSGPLALEGYKLILCFGDSLTEGFCQSGTLYRPYSDRLQERLQELAAEAGRAAPEVVNAGLSGEKTGAMLRRLPRFLKRWEDPDERLFEGQVSLVLILGGTNDLGMLHPEKITKNLLSLHEMSHTAGARTCIMTIPELRMGMDHEIDTFKDEREYVNAALRRYAAENPERTFLVDIAMQFPQDEAHSDLWEPDGVHFSETGYRALGEFLAGARLQAAPSAQPGG